MRFQSTLGAEGTFSRYLGAPLLGGSGGSSPPNFEANKPLSLKWGLKPPASLLPPKMFFQKIAKNMCVIFRGSKKRAPPFVSKNFWAPQYSISNGAPEDIVFEMCSAAARNYISHNWTSNIIILSPHSHTNKKNA